MRAPERRCAALRQADVVELACLLQPRKYAHRLLDRYVGRDAGGLEQVNPFRAPERGD